MISKTQAIIEFNITRSEYYDALDKLEDAFSGYKKLVKNGEFEAAQEKTYSKRK